MKLIKIYLALLLALLLLAQGCSLKNPQAAHFQDQADGICQDQVSGQMWQIDKSVPFKTYDEAQLYVKKLHLGGYNDWRLPTVQELYALNNLFDLHLNGTCVLDRKGNYWSQGEEGEGLAGSWEMSEQCDPARRFFTKNIGNVRAVRP